MYIYMYCHQCWASKLSLLPVPADLVSPEEEAGFYGQLILGSPGVPGDAWDLLPVIWPAPVG